MQVYDLKGEKRTEVGKKAAKAVRASEKVPCELYGEGENVNFCVLEKDLTKLLYTPMVHTVKLDIDGMVCDAMIQELQFHPVTDRVLHIDFLKIHPEKPVAIEVPVKLKGFAEGVKAGGRLVQMIRKLKVRALLADLPGDLEIDVTNLGLGKSIKVKDLSFDKFEVVNGKEVVVAQVKVTRATKTDDTAAAPAATAAAPADAAATAAAPAAAKDEKSEKSGKK